MHLSNRFIFHRPYFQLFSKILGRNPIFVEGTRAQLTSGFYSRNQRLRNSCQPDVRGRWRRLLAASLSGFFYYFLLFPQHFIKLYVNLPLLGSLRCVKVSVFSYLKTPALFRRSTCSPSDPPGFTCLAPPTLPPPHSRTSQNVSCLLAGSSVGYLELAAS